MRGKSNIWSLPKELFENYIKSGMTSKAIAKKLGTSPQTLYGVLNKYDLHVDGERHSHINSHKFDTIDTEEKAYWLGFLFADGCVNDKYVITISLAEKDKEHVLKFKHFLEDDRLDKDKVKKHMSTCSNGKKTPIYSYHVGCRHMAKVLYDYGCIPRKSLVLKFPDRNIFSNEKLIYDFIRGYVDGDGCLTMTRGRLQISMLGTIEFLTEVQKIFPQFLSINKVKHCDCNVYDMRCACKSADQVAYMLYENSSIYLTRKFLRYATLCRLHNSETSDKIGESCDANAEVTPEIAKGSENTVENSE